ncbi:MAG TPA: elongation factor G [Eubacteriales bacterium]|nr:elongation factor G [Eubacteriales bacterium]
MALINAKDIRNIALIGHSGEGKTTLAEAILFNCKAVDRQGKVDDGNSTMDFDPEEIAKKISISLATANCNYNGTKINIIDVPGYFDFEGELVQALAVADAAVIVTSASGSLTVGTEKALDICIARKIPAMIFVSGLDKENANYTDTVNAITEKYPTKIANLMIPVMQNNFSAYVNVDDGLYYEVGSEENGKEIPANMADQAASAREKVVESAAEGDDELMMKYLDTLDLTKEEVEKGLKAGIVKCATIPVYGGSALANKGIKNLLNKIVATLPSPADDVVTATDDKGNKIELKCDPNAPVVLQVFKTIVDPFVGRLSFFKMLQGTLKSGTILKNANKDSEEKISSIFFIKGKKQEPTDSISAGDIGAVSKLNTPTTGDTLSEGKALTLPPIEMPKPVISMAVYAAKKGEEDKIFAGLSKLKDEDISFAVIKNQDTNEMLLSGVGETQLDILCRKLRNKFSVEAVLKEPRIAYKETIKGRSEAEGKHKKQSGGAGQFGVAIIKFEPGAEDGIYEFADEVVGGAVPRQFIPAVDKGLREAIKEGVLAGYPMINLKARLVDGKYHPVDSKEIAFVSAAKLAYGEGIPKAQPILLEPIYQVNVTVPENYMGDILGDMNKRRGRVLGMEAATGGKQIIRAEAPMAEITKYATDLRSMTQGRGTFTMEFLRYEEVPPTATAKIIEDAKKRAAEAE